MAYDPTKPANNAPIISAELRSQFAGLKTLIDGKAHSVNNVNGLGMTAQDPPSAAQIQEIADKLDELLDALKQ